jgi:hypothetical protein
LVTARRHVDVSFASRCIAHLSPDYRARRRRLGEHVGPEPTGYDTRREWITMMPATGHRRMSKGRVGRVVTLTGRHFSLRHAVVRFGATAVASYISRSDSKIRVRVPRGTAKGRVKVTVTTLIGRSSPESFLRL